MELEACSLKLKLISLITCLVALCCVPVIPRAVGALRES